MEKSISPYYNGECPSMQERITIHRPGRERVLKNLADIYFELLKVNLSTKDLFVTTANSN